MKPTDTDPFLVVSGANAEPPRLTSAGIHKELEPRVTRPRVESRGRVSWPEENVHLGPGEQAAWQTFDTVG
jgi:hypothetical protein